MKTQLAIWLGVLLILLLQVITPAQYPEREDVLWARTAPAGSITMDGDDSTDSPQLLGI